MDPANLTALVHRAEQLAALALTPRSARGLGDETDHALAKYRTIAGLCAQATLRLRPQDGPASPEAVEVVQVFLQIARLEALLRRGEWGNHEQKIRLSPASHP